MSPADPSESTTADALALAARHGIHRLAIPTPFLVGRVNCYLIEDEPLTLLDTGPNSGKSLDELERALARHGRRIEDLQLIVLTHQHMDHVGLLEILVRRSGAQVAALSVLGRYLEDFDHSAVQDDEFAQAMMRRHGVPADLATALGAAVAAFRAFGSSGHVTRPLRDDDTLALRDRSLRVLHRPGHSPSDTTFWDERRRILLAGDHLLGHISSNPLVTRPLREARHEPGGPDEPSGPDETQDPGARRPSALIDYIDSMRATRELPAELILPGHGDPIVEHVALIDERLRMHHRRALKMLAMLGAGPLSAYEIALQMWGNVAVTQAYLTLSEVLGHMDLLARENQVREVVHDGVARFEAVAELSGEGGAARPQR
ncbi:MAG: MBL fold metallo-hydrolase [Solirubrobacteraceae bacterium]